jgi:hypothetical protein
VALNLRVIEFENLKNVCGCNFGSVDKSKNELKVLTLNQNMYQGRASSEVFHFD